MTTTVQDLINLHKAAQKYEYEHITIIKANGKSEGYSNINNLKVSEDRISFIHTYDERWLKPDSIPQVSEIEVRGEIIEKRKRIL